MMNLSRSTDHNILGSRLERVNRRSTSHADGSKRSEAGYTLVALLAMMTMLALFAMAAAPSIRQQTQREREREAIYRGEQVADAIREYYKYRSRFLNLNGDQALPSSMDQLLEGIPIPGGAKTRRVLRASAAHDPLTIEGEWRFIHPRSDALIDFQQAVMVYAGATLPTPNDTQMAQLQQVAAPMLGGLVNTGTTSTSRTGTSAGDDSSGPFVGVASRSRASSVLTFYGLENHDEWIFTPLFRN